MASTNKHQYHVLIVDDDPQIPRLIKTWLNHDYGQTLDVTCVTSSPEALGRLHQDAVDLLITDIDMPALNGYHLLKELKNINPLAQVLFLTGQPSPNAFRSARQMGADEYVLKPVTRKALKQCVHYLLKRVRRWRNDLGMSFSSNVDLIESTEY